ncbi:flagellar type III secretion system pore protein FliP [Jatrophihabitans telluris]|uniref:Flagellar biosynthetic protein FliP n=1 Tax=Jatrophihabitans telluris TaxID=2038343 RepID=A0ABY4QY97_9ACTN|nr:flagellar type III secretion system pore protein FliP [Jatrophihabitans telluris]UQX87966.1 flagellar type III secretion system pore protein FliP [Jatrophihabitans telluris]
MSISLPRGLRHLLVLLGLVGVALILSVASGSSRAEAAPQQSIAIHQVTPIGLGPVTVPTPNAPTTPSVSNAGDSSVSVNVGQKPSNSVTILILLTVISVAPSILLLMTSFTKIFVVLSLTRNALGLTGVPPNQVLAGLSLFLSLFIMGPTVSAVNKLGIQPYLKGTKSQAVAFHDGIAPMRDFMLHHTRSEEIALMLRAGHLPNPPTPDKLDLTTLIPAFVLSELRSAMIIGFVIYIPFLIIDMVVSSSLMSLGMMMLPPVSVSLPFKLLLFVLVDGWGLIITALIHSYQT